MVTGHHELHRQGELVIFDPSKGRKETSGVVQRIPGYQKEVSPITCDLPIAQSWPKFMHPFPITDKLFLVSCKRSPESGWNICLVDVFDNIVPLLVEPEATLEPIPLRETERQRVLPSRIDPESSIADFFIADVYEGEGLKGVPRGAVKSLRIFSYEFSYQGMGAEPYSVGLDGPWDPRRIIGTVPVNEDGSAFFKAPAYTPISPAARRRRSRVADYAQLDHGAPRRIGLLRRMPRAPGFDFADHPAFPCVAERAT